MIFGIALLAAGGFQFSEVGGVKLSCLENVRGKVGRARIEVVVGSGALAESAQERGLAHLVEHVLSRPLGFDHQNAETTLDSTVFYKDVRTTELSTAAAELVEALRSVQVDGDQFALEREVVLRELEQRGEESYLVDVLFSGTPIDRPVGGTVSTVRELTIEDVHRFHARHYVKGNMAVLLRGAAACDAAKSALLPHLLRLGDGPPSPVPEVAQKEPGPRSLGRALGAQDFIRGFYWYHASAEDELLMMIAAKHLEQRALDELRKAQGLTYSPEARFLRLAGGGLIMLSVHTSKQDRLVDAWYERTLGELKSSATPKTLTKSAIAFVADGLEAQGARAALSAIRGQPLPEEALEKLTDEGMHARLEALLAKERTFGTATPTTNLLSLLILGGFGVIVLGVIGLASRRLLSSR